MERISKNFTMEEMTGGVEFPEKVKDRLRALVKNVLQPLRDHFGKPVHVNSGARTIAHNKAVGGDDLSQHLFGEAGDVTVEGVPCREVYDHIRNHIDYDQVILERKGNDEWVHVSYVENRKNAFEKTV